jgi:tetratricopeptide (TPR) repeat protein
MNKNNTRKFQTIFYLLILIFCSSNTFSQAFDFLKSTKENTENDLWKKERLNYYLDSQKGENNKPESYFYSAQDKIRNGSYEAAIKDFKKSIKVEIVQQSALSNIEEGPSNKAAFLGISHCFYWMNNLDSSIYYCQKSIDEDKYFEDAYVQKAQLISEKDNNKEAIKFLLNTENIFPSSKRINFTIAQLYLEKQNYIKTKKYLKKVIKIDPDFEKAHLLFATIQIRMGNYGSSFKILTKSIENSKKPIISYYIRSVIYSEYYWDSKSAYEDLESAYLLDTINNPVIGYLAFYDFYYENYERAARLLQESLNKKDEKNKDKINWQQYYYLEFRYFINFINDSTNNKSDIQAFNMFMNSSLLNKPEKYKEETTTYLKYNPKSNFAKRLNIFAKWVYKSDTRTYVPKEDFAFNFSKGLGKISIEENLTDYKNQIDSIYLHDSTIISINLLKSHIEFMEENYEEAIKLANYVISSDSNLYDPLIIKAYSYLRQENYEKALNDLTKLEQASPYYINFKRALTLANFKLGNYSKALELNSFILDSLKSPSPNDFHNQGLCYQAKNENNKALKYFIIANDKYPSHNDFIFSLVNIYKSIGNYDAAIEELKKETNKTYSDFMLLIDLADLYVEIEDYENAIKYYVEATSRDESYTYAYLGAGDCYQELHKYMKAIRFYKMAIEKLPEHAYTYYAVGQCYFNLDKFNESIKWTFDAIKHDDKFSEAYQLMADNYFSMKKYTLSQSFDLQALKISPDNKNIQYHLAITTLAKGETEQANNLFIKIINTETEIKSEDFNKAKEMLNNMLLNNIYSTEVNYILENIFDQPKKK